MTIRNGDAPVDAVVVGSGPNGLSAAITLARAGLTVAVYEAETIPGGSARSSQLTLPGFTHDLCSAVHPLGVTSPFMRSLALSERGLEWIYPPTACAHPLDGGESVTLEHSIDETSRQLGVDAGRYRELMLPLVDSWEDIFEDILRHPLTLRRPRNFRALARFGRSAVYSAEAFARGYFRGERARALFVGAAAHANCPLRRRGTAAIGLTLLIAAHARGWPIPKGGTQKISNALIETLEQLGGRLHVGRRISEMSDLPKHKLALFDLMPEQAAGILKLTDTPFKSFRHGNGVFKIDWALQAPIPWQSPAVTRAGTVHLGGTMDEMVEAESAPEAGRHPERPYVLLSQPSLFDSSRAPDGRHVAWAYCHVPFGSQIDMTEKIEDQIERFAPGFRELILQRSVMNTSVMEQKNANLVGGDIGAGEFSLWRTIAPNGLFGNPYLLSHQHHAYLCSAATPPGPGVHGMCGYHAALLALRRNQK